MGLNDRDWMHENRRAGNDNADEPLGVRGLILVNILVFVICFLSGRLSPGRFVGWEFVKPFGEYSFDSAFRDGHLWELVTYQFMHANIGHIVFNMICLWVIGAAVEKYCGHLTFLRVYLVCGIAAAVFSSLLGSLGFFDGSYPYPLSWDTVPMVGASGSIYGIIAASAVLFPHARIMLLFPPVEMSVRVFALAVLGLAILYVSFNWNNAGGEAGHMGGMLMGFAIMGVLYLMKKVRPVH